MLRTTKSIKKIDLPKYYEIWLKGENSDGENTGFDAYNNSLEDSIEKTKDKNLHDEDIKTIDRQDKSKHLALFFTIGDQPYTVSLGGLDFSISPLSDIENLHIDPNISSFSWSVSKWGKVRTIIAYKPLISFRLLEDSNWSLKVDNEDLKMRIEKLNDSLRSLRSKEVAKSENNEKENRETELEAEFERKLSEQERDELRRINNELRGKLDTLKGIEEIRKNQLQKLREEEEQVREQIKNDFNSINRATISFKKLDTEKLAECLSKLQEMKNWLINGTRGQQTVIKEKYGQLKEILNRLELEKSRRKTKQVIAEELVDLGTNLEERVELEWRELKEEKYKYYSDTLDQMESQDEIDKFEKKILQVIIEQRQRHKAIFKVFSFGEAVIKSGDVEQMEAAITYLKTYQKLQQEGWEENNSFFVIKLGEFLLLINKLEKSVASVQQNKQVARVEQPMNTQ